MPRGGVVDPHPPAHERDQLRGDRQAQPRAAESPGDRSVHLLERLEDPLARLRRDADAGVGHLEGDHGGGEAGGLSVGAPPAGGGGDHEAHPAVLGELEGVGEEVLEHLLEALRVGEEAAGEVRVDLHVEGEPSVLGLVPEGPGDGLDERVEGDLLRLDRPAPAFPSPRSSPTPPFPTTRGRAFTPRERAYTSDPPPPEEDHAHKPR